MISQLEETFGYLRISKFNLRMNNKKNENEP